MFGGIGGTLSALAPNGRPISPMTTGFTGGGVDFPGWGLTIAADGKVWVTSIGGKTISVFDQDRKTAVAIDGLQPEWATRRNAGCQHDGGWGCLGVGFK